MVLPDLLFSDDLCFSLLFESSLLRVRFLEAAMNQKILVADSGGGLPPPMFSQISKKNYKLDKLIVLGYFYSLNFTAISLLFILDYLNPKATLLTLVSEF